MGGKIEGKVWLKNKKENERSVGNLCEKETKRDSDSDVMKVKTGNEMSRGVIITLGRN
jgi:hypothetical protein